MTILDSIKNFQNLAELEEFLVNKYYENNAVYIPAIINEGVFSLKSGEDFYSKLVLVNQRVVLSKPWKKGNLTFGIYDPDSILSDNLSLIDLFVENVITYRRVKGKNLFQINPNIVTEEIEEYEYDNNVHVNAFFSDEFSGKGKPVLKYENNNLFVVKDILKPYLNSSDSFCYPKYKLVIDFEYRTHFYSFSNIQTGMITTKKGVYDISIDDYGLRILGSVEIQLNENQLHNDKRPISVIDLNSLKARDHNPNNFNDDINVGFIVFSKDIIGIIKRDFYFYDLMIFDKTNNNNRFLIDVLDDKVMFWEGEYNKLPNDLKDKIDLYNLKILDLEGIISSAMEAWQLNSDWNYMEKLPPEQKLAWKIREQYFSNAFDVGLTFLIPDNIREFQEFIQKIEKVIPIKLSNFNPNQKDVYNLMMIEKGTEINLTNNEIETLYRKYCFQLYRGLTHD